VTELRPSGQPHPSRPYPWGRDRTVESLAGPSIGGASLKPSAGKRWRLCEKSKSRIELPRVYADLAPVVSRILAASAVANCSRGLFAQSRWFLNPGNERRRRRCTAPAPMLENVFPSDELGALARRKRVSYVQRSLPADQLDSAAADGWKPVGRKRTGSIRVRKDKSLDVLLEDRVWSCLFSMGFKNLSGERGARLVIDPKDDGGPTTQIDVLAIDEEVVIAVECKSAAKPRKDPRFQEELAKHGILRDRLSKAAGAQFPAGSKRRVVLALFTSNLLLTANDRKRAEDQHIAVFDENDLGYYEALVRQLGPAARYQFLCDLIPGGSVSGLDLTVPAIKAQMGGADCYAFCATPDYLLKICYVAHRAKGKGSDIDTYQRMVSKSRLTRIRRYISDNKIFPTNLVVSVQDPALLRFDRGKQEGDNTGGVFGWLHLSPTYKSAWIIDGQHRLFAYSGHEQSATSLLLVLAFVGLPSSEQAQLFIDINGEQRRVKRNLLEELFAELHWNSPDETDRIAAIISKAVQQIDNDVDSAFYGRILKTDEERSHLRCISLTTMFKALERPGFYVLRTKKGHITEFGPLWAGENDKTLRRTCAILNAWFGQVKLSVPDWWEMGSGEGGGLSMNDGVTIVISVLRGAFQHLESQGSKLGDLEDHELLERVRPYATALGDYLRDRSSEERRAFRELRGAQGQTRGSFMALKGIKDRVQGFNPPGLAVFLDHQLARTTEQAQAIIGEIERTLHRVILQELRQEFQEGERWWFDGVPKAVRSKVDERINDDQGKRGGREDNFDLIDYRAVVLQNWSLFGEMLGFSEGNGKERRTQWLVRVNEIRRTAMHPSRSVGVSFHELQELQQWRDLLNQRVAPHAG
jgi:DNA sulfur modification protein DndB